MAAARISNGMYGMLLTRSLLEKLIKPQIWDTYEAEEAQIGYLKFMDKYNQ